MYADVFELLDFYHIHEILSLSAQRLMQPNFSMSEGNAAFLLAEAKREVERIDRAAGKKRRVERDSHN
jgi:hypothetical protein